MFPGAAANYEAVTNVSDMALLADAMVWAATDAACANEAFNVVNGDQFRWRDMWPRLAAAFDMAPGPVRTTALARDMAAKAPVWDAVVARYGLEPIAFERLGDWAFIDATLRVPWHQVASTVKAHRYGFHRTVDTYEMFDALLAEYRRLRLLP